jgi:hypothetical protein
MNDAQLEGASRTRAIPCLPSLSLPLLPTLCPRLTFLVHIVLGIDSVDRACAEFGHHRSVLEPFAFYQHFGLGERVETLHYQRIFDIGLLKGLHDNNRSKEGEKTKDVGKGKASTNKMSDISMPSGGSKHTGI